MIGCLFATLPMTAQNFSVDKNVVCIYSSEVTDTVKMVVLSDTHLWMSDSREEPYRQYSQRMAGAYHQTKHFQTGEETIPKEAFMETITLAKSKQADAIAILGDMFSYPSEAAIEWTLDTLKQTGVPFLYTCGNHDWHYEGMEGSSKDLRDTWVKKRLLPMFQGNHPLCYAKEIKGACSF